MKLSTAWLRIAGGVKGGMISISVSSWRSTATVQYSILSRDAVFAAN
jgi:hypothetical protein